MRRSGIHLIRISLSAALLLAAGCVERKLTITTDPPGAVVWLNEEEIGPTPAAVRFKWYGDYKVRIQKSGYEILDTHRPLDAPLHDHFPLDLLASLWPGTIENQYEWHFELNPAVLPTNEQIIEQARAFRQNVQEELSAAEIEVQRQLEEK